MWHRNPVLPRTGSECAVPSTLQHFALRLLKLLQLLWVHFSLPESPWAAARPSGTLASHSLSPITQTMDEEDVGQDWILWVPPANFVITASWTWLFSFSSPPCLLCFIRFSVSMLWEKVVKLCWLSLMVSLSLVCLEMIPRITFSITFAGMEAAQTVVPQDFPTPHPSSPVPAQKLALTLHHAATSLFKAVCVCFLCSIFGVFLPGWHADGFFLMSAPSMGTLEQRRRWEQHRAESAIKLCRTIPYSASSLFHGMFRGQMHISVLFTKKRHQRESIWARYFACHALICLTQTMDVS